MPREKLISTPIRNTSLQLRGPGKVLEKKKTEKRLLQRLYFLRNRKNVKN